MVLSCHCRYSVFSASAWLTRLTRNTAWLSVSELKVTARLGSLLVKMTTWPCREQLMLAWLTLLSGWSYLEL